MQNFSRATKIYLYTIYAAGLMLTLFNIASLQFHEPIKLLLLCVLASLTLIYNVEGPTNRSHYAISFVVYAFTFTHLGLPEAILTILVSGLALWMVRKQTPWFIQIFNIFGYIIVMQTASLVVQGVNPGGSLNSWPGVAGIILAMLAFTLLNHLMVGMIIWLARAENFAQSGVFGFLTLTIDLTLLILGASLSIVWNYNPFAIILFLVPLYLLYSTLRVPALERQTEVDEKTGLYNHRFFTREMEQELNRANRFDRPMSVIMADLDLLRNINNTYGHLAGDEVILGIAKILKNSVREYDVVARFGGEEFSILLPETPVEKALERAELLRKEIEAAEFTIPTSILPIRSTMSFGVACRERFDQEPNDILHLADLALYKSKFNGRNCVSAYVEQVYYSYSPENPPAALTVEQGSSETSPETIQPAQIHLPIAHPVPSGDPLADSAVQRAAVTEQPEPPPAPEQVAPAVNRKWATNIYIAASVAAAVLLYYLVSAHPLYTALAAGPINYLGLTMFVLFVGLTEWFSIDIYIRNTTVSTSAAPILAGTLLFGPVGALVLGSVFALTALLKNRSPFSRFFFNASNQVIASMLYLGLIALTGRSFNDWGQIPQIIIVLLAAIVVYFVTTGLVAVGMSISLHLSFYRVWNEQFAWLAPFYVGIGFITYAIMFGYQQSGLLGMLIMIVPLALLRFSQKQAIDRTRSMVAELREKNVSLMKSADEISELNLGLLETLAESIDMHDPYVMGHSRQVTIFAVQIAQRMGLKEKQIEVVRKGSLLHDVGKLGIPDTILSKPTRLTREEYEIIKRHPQAGATLISKSSSLGPLLPIVLHHHEFYDGHGYPSGLKGNQIPIEARIVSVADTIEAMGADRPYRKALEVPYIINELKRCSGTQFDPRVVQVAVKLLEGEGQAMFQRSTKKAETVFTM